jgi:hypothetical protein
MDSLGLKILGVRGKGVGRAERQWVTATEDSDEIFIFYLHNNPMGSHTSVIPLIPLIPFIPLFCLL